MYSTFNSWRVLGRVYLIHYTHGKVRSPNTLAILGSSFKESRSNSLLVQLESKPCSLDGLCGEEWRRGHAMKVCMWYIILYYITILYILYYLYLFIHENCICTYTPGSKRLAQLPKGVTVRAYDTPIHGWWLWLWGKTVETAYLRHNTFFYASLWATRSKSQSSQAPFACADVACSMTEPSPAGV